MHPGVVILIIVVIAILIWLLIWFFVDDDQTTTDEGITFATPTFITGTASADTKPKHQALVERLSQNGEQTVTHKHEGANQVISSVNVEPLLLDGITSTHEQIWRRIAQSGSGWHLILDDTVRLHPQFLQLFPHYLNEIPSDAKIVYVGYDASDDLRIVNEYAKATLITSNEVPNLAPAPSNKIIRQAVRGTHAYMLNPEGARYLLEHILPLEGNVSDNLYQHFSTHEGSYVFNGNITLGGLRPSNYRRICKDVCITHGGIVYQTRKN